MSASLVGSEMCIRDRAATAAIAATTTTTAVATSDAATSDATSVPVRTTGCLLYTSDAADDM
eukprot:102394-Alexandrium_andersonii.AAC.1